MKPIIILPARLASTRLPNKPLALIGGEPMIVQVWKRAVAAGVGDVAVACDGQEIFDAVTKAGGRAVLTDADLPSGSDRIFQALQTIDPDKKYDVVINVQGDMPTLDSRIVARAAQLLEDPAVDIGTLAAVIKDDAEKTDPAVVKIAISAGGKALYFSRATIPAGDGPLYHHIGIYAYRRAALETFVSLPPSPLEQREKLEQLRALEAGMTIHVSVVDAVPLGVDTPETLEKARKHYEQI
ncbi:MAG: 3-deoxy-manno-octulosonate cytidylyltransferase [Alphaproteobacteria bacterium]|nr:3-deoxy-manno-octulosonate cytidylyltransferase [Alphaproteobacteria bacterium]